MDEKIKNKITETVQDLLRRVGFEGEVRLNESLAVVDPDNSTNNSRASLMVASVESENDLSMLIGKNGQNLSAFEHIARLLVSRNVSITASQSPISFIVDINDYRKSRTNYLVDVARNVAKRVIQTQRAEALLPMNAYERRLVHTELATFKDLQTESIGQEPRRRIVVKPSLPL
ncbi:MAG: hypothetical protein A2831_02400 [Candidatus Yanofskybacteria bacterium RIFCSPHIGHO2_01_FULL_44_17]|uniref:R3H domain-containing protein n=1 Tax=Candidatus Yanofskybacteria bacterium RIFCSPHIGHO2_01_FULL_44_17 TaxID=1802668 RepID=A0A1F8ESQ8_9BACT|nr:MAG: hypothetical protein A2831_02400 [Candidatus Yanofskybacteria bacterium RIFCSPHIGHO2_01_FULL_44_17]